jgi:4-amino-4-deoxy-L-arabinose transferase-like glycosyltransferase
VRKLLAASRAEQIGFAAIMVMASFLILWNLGNQYLWQDEAQTALISRSVVTHGVPVGFDGRNSFSQELGREYGSNYLWKWHTWLPFYILAGFFALFGESALIARLPFALSGIATVAATYALAHCLWRDRRAAAAAAIVLATSVPFLLLARQARFYALAALLAVLILYAYWQLMERRRFAGPGLAAALVLLFHTNYLYVGALVVAVFAHAMLWHRDRLKALALWIGASTLCAAPWFIWLSSMPGGRMIPGRGKIVPGAAWLKLMGFTEKLTDQLFDPVLLLIPAALVGVHLFRRNLRTCMGSDLWRPLSCLLLVLAVTLAALSLKAPGPFFRYLTPLLPLVAIIIGGIAVIPMRVHWVLGVPVVAWVILISPIADYGYELTHDFDGPIEGIVTYLNTHGDEDDLVAITYGDLPVKFYTPMRVIGGFAGDDLSPASDADWVIIRRNVNSGKRDGKVKQHLEQNLDRDNYRRILLNFPDTQFENREELDAHRFRTAKGVPPVIVFQKIR